MRSDTVVRHLERFHKMTRQEAKEAKQLQKQVGESTVIGQERSAPI